MTLYEALNGRFEREAHWQLPPDTIEPEASVRDHSTAPQNLLHSVDLDGYAHRQNERTLTIAAWITVLTGVVLGVVSALAKDWVSTISLISLAALCAPVYEVNKRYGQRTAGGLLSFAILTAITINMIDGPGLHSLSIIGYPVLIAIGGLTLGKKTLWILTAACHTSLLLVAGLQWAGWIHDAGHPFRPRDLLILSVLLGATAVVVWVSMDNTQKNIDRIRRSEATVRLAYERTLEAWGRALEYRDQETEGHSRRVSELAVRLGCELNIEPEALTRLRWGALLHDIGKLAVPDAILLKPGPLTADERRLMMNHPVYARDMLAGIPFLRSVVDIPYHHHERWDGDGYPEGLRGKEIPLSARIFAVVDQWEALSSDRPYRKAWEREEVLAHMETEAGAAFDPEIVRVFLDRVAPDL